jgi:hypothetical protein
MVKNWVVAQMVNKLKAFYETQMFIAMFTRSHHWILS